jgi:hypothetical protein
MKDGLDAIEIEAAGKVLSQKNASALTSAMKNLLDVAIDAKILTVEALKLFIEEEASETSEEEATEDSDDKTAIQSEATQEEDIPVEPIQAASFKDHVERVSWGEKLRAITNSFSMRFETLSMCPDNEMRYMDGRGKTDSADREPLIDSLLGDLFDLLNQLKDDSKSILSSGGPYALAMSSSTPEDKQTEIQGGEFRKHIEKVSWGQRLNTIIGTFANGFERILLYPEDMGAFMFADNKISSRESPDRVAMATSLMEDLFSLLRQLRTEANKCRNESTPLINASSADEDPDSTEIEVSLVWQDSCVINASKQEEGNRHPISGVLFRIDEISEGIPAVGPGLPLYIPYEVAASTLNKVAGLPLDAHDSLSEHANEEITGVIQSAHIGGADGKDYNIDAYLWPWSKSAKVQAIRNNSDRLGMSMNAFGRGQEAEIDGRKVFKLSSLNLLGANILYSNKATYQKTKIAASSANEVEGESENNLREILVEIAAGKYDYEDPEAILEESLPNEIDTVEINAQTGEQSIMDEQKILDSIAALGKTFENSVSDLSSRIAPLEKAHQEETSAIAASKQEEQQRLSAAALEQTVIAAMQKVINPSGSPARRTVPLAASMSTEASVDTGINSIALQLAAVQGELATWEQMPIGTPNANIKISELIEKKRQLQFQLQG